MATITLEGSVFTEDDVRWLYDIYLWNVVNLSNHMNVLERSIFDLNPLPGIPMIIPHNEFINQDHKFNSLGEDIYQNGMFWILFVSENNMVYEGHHRVSALRAYCTKNKTDVRVPCLQLDPAKFKEGLPVKYPHAPAIRHFKRFGRKSRVKNVDDQFEYMKKLLIIPCEYNNVFFSFREKARFVGSPIVNSYEELLKKKNEMSLLPPRD